VLKRPAPHPALGALRLAVTVFLALHVFISAWLVATVDATYTEGRPSPTEIHSLVAVDKDRTLIDIEIERATSLMLYSLSRDRGIEPVNQTGVDQDEPTTSTPSETDWLSVGRAMVVGSLLLLVVAEGLVVARVRRASWYRFGSFMLVLLMFFIVFPITYVMDLGAQQSAAQNSPGFDLEDTSFVHVTTASERRFVWLGVELDASFSGYDLGLVAEENRTNVTATPPLEGTSDAKSYIAFESTFSVQYGKNLDAMFVLPFLWLVLPGSTHRKQSSVEEE
jgi:hypothetical protein